MQGNYDYIITGAGCAGLSLLRRMMVHPFFRNKKILLIDKEQKNNNDRTWCFWEQQPGLFEEIVYHRWQQIDFYSDHFSARYDLAPYQYKMIRSMDLYSSVLDKARRFSNISILQEDVQSVANNENHVTVRTNSKELLADHVFNSIIFNDWKQEALQRKNVYVLLQHFKGWLIETDKDVFDEDIVESFKIYLINQTNEPYDFTYTISFLGSPGFELKNRLFSLTDFYLHDVLFEEMNDGADRARPRIPLRQTPSARRQPLSILTTRRMSRTSRPARTGRGR